MRNRYPDTLALCHRLLDEKEARIKELELYCGETRSERQIFWIHKLKVHLTDIEINVPKNQGTASSAAKFLVALCLSPLEVTSKVYLFDVLPSLNIHPRRKAYFTDNYLSVLCLYANEYLEKLNLPKITRVYAVGFILPPESKAFVKSFDRLVPDATY